MEKEKQDKTFMDKAKNWAKIGVMVGLTVFGMGEKEAQAHNTPPPKQPRTGKCDTK